MTEDNTAYETAGAAVNPGFCPSCLKPSPYCICVTSVPSEARPQPPATGERDYLRSVVEQIHRDAHDALAEVQARPGPEVVEEAQRFYDALGLGEYTPVPESPETPEEEPTANNWTPFEEEPLCETCDGSGEEEAPFTDSLDYGPRWMKCRNCGGSGSDPFRARPQEVDEGEWRRDYEHGENVVWIAPDGREFNVPVGAEQAIASRAVAEAEARSGDWRRLAGENGRLLREAVAQIDRLQARAERAEEERDRLRAALETWESKYGWWNDDDTVRTCGICEEEGEHSDICPMRALRSERGE